jgi:polar amino acid transport system substrate-binding protein
MKTTKLIAVITIIFSAYLAYAQSNINKYLKEDSERKTLVIAGDYWCPYNCLPDSESPGYLVELIEKALYIYSIDVEYRIMSWNDAIKLAEKGEVDAIVGIGDIRGKNLLTTSLPLEYSMTDAFTRNDTEWIYDGIDSLRGKKIGVVMGGIIDEVTKHYIGINYPINPGAFSVQEEKNAVIESIADLIDSDSDVYIEDYRVVHGLDPYIRNAGHVGKIKAPVYIAFSKALPDSTKYIQYFTEGIASLKATGEYDSLRLKYNMDNGEINGL